MNGLALLIPLALLLGLLGLAAFFWSVRSGQYEDMDGAAMRVLIDDDEPTITRSSGNGPK
ncbi:cbb3-type cytochrome oxidase assembly protein CcoS [Sphingomonas turrisvirgatae]|uniref:Cytochrome oxidase maturation protein, cbb3-type n=1 Tax=Sphingomonas turrisvirgatae TaxID=1888892 RepID=A0A1E3LW33_9SPHN|nr:cbb3-type cytochrome oxidase assembly protein CcoS [Sphingomonas turrisvirgatae]ODP37946.1 cytochrome oxidase maturation protein, cbb3-type [Sphingomonas turrisvirgatae]